MNIRKYLTILFFAFSVSTQAQCIIGVKGLPCINNPLEFLSNTPGATNHNWNFNNEGFNNTNSNPTFTFATIGTKTITYSCTLPNGNPCSSSITVVIKDRPKIKIRLLSDSVQCFENNIFCFVDSSVSGDNDYCIKSIKYLFSDGELITKYGSKNKPVSLPSNFCKSYLDPQGAVHTLTVEIEDCNGCIYKQQMPFTMKVQMLPPISAIFDEKSSNCNGTVRVKFTNQTQMSRSNVSKFIWDFGDGSKDSTNWDSVFHDYTSGNKLTKIFSPKLIIYTGNGCKREFNLKDIVVFNFKPFITKDRDSICVGETINYKLFPLEMKDYISEIKIRWDFDPGIDFAYQASNSYQTVGPHIVTCTVPHVCGPYVLYDTITVIGPKSVIEPDWIDPYERYQCQAKDTVHVADHSDYYHNDHNFLDDDSLLNKKPAQFKYAFKFDPRLGRNVPLKPFNYDRNDVNVERIWDFDDPYCLPCTSDRKANMNLGLNCRYSRDSADYHVYTDWDSVYNYLYTKAYFNLAYFDPIVKTCSNKKIWYADSLYAVTDSVLYYADNALGLKAKDSSVFKHVKHFIKINAGLKGKAVYDPFSDLRVYIPSGCSIQIDKKDGSAFLQVNGPQLYNVSNFHRIITGQNDSCFFVYGIKIFKDTLPLNWVKNYHLRVHKVKLPNIRSNDSINSILHRRLFYQIVPRCFKITLSLRDTVHPMHCFNQASAAVALLPPSAKRLSINDHYCYGYNAKVLEFSLEDTKPGCLSPNVQFNPDYIKNPDDWNLLNNLYYGDMARNVFLNGTPPYKGYAKEGPNNGLFYWVYNDSILGKKNIQDINLALIVGNGLSPDECADTVYYKNFASFPRLSPDIVFATNNKSVEHTCKDTFVYVYIPSDRPDANFLANQSSWYIIDNRSGDTLERIDETYFKVRDHYKYPNQKVNYTVIERSKINKHKLKLVQTDTLFTAIVHKYKAIALPGAGLNELKKDMARLGFDINDFSDSTVLDFIWNGVGVIGNPTTGSKGCFDTTGYGYLLKYYYKISSATVLSFKDSSLYPADSALINNKYKKVYAFRVDHNSSYNIYRNISSYFPGYCALEDFVTVAVGFSAKVEFSDTIICIGKTLEATTDFRYFSTDSSTFSEYDTTKYWFKRMNQAGANNREGLTIWDYSKEDDDVNKPATIFGNFPYSKKGYGTPFVILGNEQSGIYYKKAGIYTLRVLASDSNYCTDTFTQKIYVTGPKAGFYTDIITPNCKTILELFDTSKIIDPCAAKGLDPCDFIYKWNIDWGDGSGSVDYFKQLPKQIGHDYTKNGYYTITLTIESILGCRDTVQKQVFIPGPSPEFKPLTSLRICVNDSVAFRNFSGNYTESAQWLWNFGDGFYIPQKDTGKMVHQYKIPGTYDVFLSQYDSIANTGKYCADIYPDVNKGQKKITVIVSPYDVVKLIARPMIICVGDTIRAQANVQSANTYNLFNWTVGNVKNQTNSLFYNFAPKKRGQYLITMLPDTNGINGAFCPGYDSLWVVADSVKADFTIDETQKPKYCFTNTSQWAISYRWGFFHDKDIRPGKLEFKANVGQYEPERYICENFALHPGENWICLEATNALGCHDTVCKKIYNDFEFAILPPNVFTPSGNDGFVGTDKEGLQGNNVFNIYTKNVSNYHLIIYDRWGVKVFESDDTGYDWNGHLNNTGEECPDGTYYYILNYRYIGKDKDEPILNGVVKLIWE